MKIEPFKMRVTPEQSRKVQDIVEGSHKIIKSQDNSKINWLFFDDYWFSWTASIEYGEKIDCSELTYAEFINLYAWEPKEGEVVLFKDKDALSWVKTYFLFTDKEGNHWGLNNVKVARHWEEIKRIPPEPQENLDFMQIMGAPIKLNGTN